MGWIVLCLAAVVVACLIVIAVRRQRAFRAGLGSRTHDQWRMARDATITAENAHSRGGDATAGGG